MGCVENKHCKLHLTAERLFLFIHIKIFNVNVFVVLTVRIFLCGHIELKHNFANTTGVHA